MMKQISAFFLVFTILTCSCNDDVALNEASFSESSVSKNETSSELAAKMFGKLISTAIPDTKIVGNTISVRGKEISIHVTVENALEKEGKQVVALGFRLHIDGKEIPRFRSGAIGIDDDKEGALRTAIYEWVMQFGAPMAFAILNRDMGVVTINSDVIPDDFSALHNVVVDNLYAAFYGPTGLRGEVVASGELSSRKFVKSMLKTVMGILGGSESQAPYVTANIMIVVQGDIAAGSECRINGEVSLELAKRLKKRTWPTANPTYIYKQYFVIIKRPEGQ